MEHREHVSRLVGGRLQRPQQAEPERFLALVGVAVAIDRPDAHSVAERRLAEHEVPPLARPEVGRGEGDVGRSVLGQTRVEHLAEHIG